MIAVLMVAVLALQSAAPQQQRNDTRTWYQAYTDAVGKIQKSDWQGALADIEFASRRGAPKPGRNVRTSGDNYINFNPDYYLGLAYLGLNRNDDADRAFERVKQAQLIGPKDALYSNFNRVSASVRDAIAKATAAQTAPVTPDVFQTKPPPTTTAVQPPARNSDPLATAAPPPVTQTMPGLTPTEKDPSYSNVPQPKDPAPSVQQSPTQQSLNRPPTGKAPPANSRVPPSNNAPRTIPTPQPTSPKAAAEERLALLDFFTGEYAAARVKLEALVSSGAASPRGRYYLACSLIALGLSGGMDKDAAMTAARLEIAAAGTMGSLMADPSLLSPRIKRELGFLP